MLVDFAGFKELIDSLGGVTLYNKRKIVSSQPFDGHNWVFPKGTITLDGRRALAYSRIRHTTNPQDSDITRTERQQLVMQSLSPPAGVASSLLHLPSIGSVAGQAADHRPVGQRAARHRLEQVPGQPHAASATWAARRR